MQVTSEEGYRLFKLGRWSTQKQMCLECLLLAKAGNERMCPAWEQRGSGTASAFRQKQMPSCHEDGFWGGWERTVSKGARLEVICLIPTLSSSVWVVSSPLMSLTVDSVCSVLYQCLSHLQQKMQNWEMGISVGVRTLWCPHSQALKGRTASGFQQTILQSSSIRLLEWELSNSWPAP